MSHLQTECAITVHWSYTGICVHMYSQTSHTHTLSSVQLHTHYPLSAMLTFADSCPFLQDDSGWPQVESSLANNKQLENLKLSGCDAFLANMGKALTKNTSIKELRLFSESL